MPSIGTLTVDTAINTKPLSTGVKVAAGVLAGLGVAAFKAVKSASALEEAQNASGEVFASSAKQVEKWSKSTTDAFSQTDFLSAAKGFATFGRAADLTDKQTATFSKGLLDAAGDLASFHDANPKDVLDDLKSGLAGETEPLRKYGILINEAALKQQALKMGLSDGKRALTEREKVLARNALILGQLGAAEGDWERTLKSAANQERLSAANNADLGAQLGQVLLPAYKMLLGVGLTVTAWLADHQGVVRVTAGVLAALAAIVLLTAGAMKVYRTAVIIATAANRLMNASLRTQRILMAFSIVGALILIGAAIVVAWKKYERFRDIVKGVLNAVVGAVRAAVGFIREHWQKLIFLLGPAGPLVLVIVKLVKHWGKIKAAGKAAFDGVRSAVQLVWGAIQAVISAIRDAINWLERLDDKAGNIGSTSGIDLFRRATGLASGGIVTRPTFAMVGEAGPEAVIPLSRLGSGGGGGGGGDRGTVRVIVVGGDREAIRYLRRLDTEEGKRNGGQGLLP